MTGLAAFSFPWIEPLSPPLPLRRVSLHTESDSVCPSLSLHLDMILIERFIHFNVLHIEDHP